MPHVTHCTLSCCVAPKAMFIGSLIIRIVVTFSISVHFNHSNSKVFLCNVYISISITYLNSKFGISSKKKYFGFL